MQDSTVAQAFRARVFAEANGRLLQRRLGHAQTDIWTHDILTSGRTLD